VLYNMKKIDEAQASFTRAIKLRAGFAEAHYNLGQIFSEKGEKAKAVAEYKAALAANPKYDAARIALAKLQEPEAK